MRSGRNWRSKELSERFLIATKRECPWGGNSPLLSCICLFACFHYRCSPMTDCVRPVRTPVFKMRTKVYRKGGSNLVGSSRHFHNYVQKTSPDSPKAARRGIFIITNKAPASPYNDASPPASYPSPSSGGSACFSHFHPASS